MLIRSRRLKEREEILLLCDDLCITLTEFCFSFHFFRCRSFSLSSITLRSSPTILLLMWWRAVNIKERYLLPRTLPLHGTSAIIRLIIGALQLVVCPSNSWDRESLPVRTRWQTASLLNCLGEGNLIQKLSAFDFIHQFQRSHFHFSLLFSEFLDLLFRHNWVGEDLIERSRRKGIKLRLICSFGFTPQTPN